VCWAGLKKEALETPNMVFAPYLVVKKNSFYMPGYEQTGFD
jgi:hypothetical protein